LTSPIRKVGNRIGTVSYAMQVSTDNQLPVIKWQQFIPQEKAARFGGYDAVGEGHLALSVEGARTVHGPIGGHRHISGCKQGPAAARRAVRDAADQVRTGVREPTY